MKRAGLFEGFEYGDQIAWRRSDRVDRVDDARKLNVRRKQKRVGGALVYSDIAVTRHRCLTSCVIVAVSSDAGASIGLRNVEIFLDPDGQAAVRNSSRRKAHTLANYDRPCP